MIYGFHGLPRSGKTLLMTYIAFHHYLAGRKIFTNYKFEFPTMDEMIESGLSDFYMENYDYDISQVNLQKPQPLDLDYIIDNMPDSAIELRFATIMLDELWTWMDARMSMDKRTIFLGYLLLQTGKHHVDVNFSSQQVRLVDWRVEFNTNYQFFCERYPDDHESELLGVFVKLYDNMRKRYKFRKLWTNFHLVYGMYDTEQPIWNPHHSDKGIREREILRKVKEMSRESR